MFKIGQKVVCVKTHSDGLVKANKVYTIRYIDTCQCGIVLLDIRVPIGGYIYSICKCGRTIANPYLFDQRLFRPLEYNTCHEELIEKFKSPEEKPDTVKEPEHEKA